MVGTEQIMYIQGQQIYHYINTNNRNFGSRIILHIQRCCSSWYGPWKSNQIKESAVQKGPRAEAQATTTSRCACCNK